MSNQSISQEGNYQKLTLLYENISGKQWKKFPLVFTAIIFNAMIIKQIPGTPYLIADFVLKIKIHVQD